MGTTSFPSSVQKVSPYKWKRRRKKQTNNKTTKQTKQQKNKPPSNHEEKSIRFPLILETKECFLQYFLHNFPTSQDHLKTHEVTSSHSSSLSSSFFSFLPLRSGENKASAAFLLFLITSSLLINPVGVIS